MIERWSHTENDVVQLDPSDFEDFEEWECGECGADNEGYVCRDCGVEK